MVETNCAFLIFGHFICCSVDKLYIYALLKRLLYIIFRSKWNYGELSTSLII